MQFCYYHKAAPAPNPRCNIPYIAPKFSQIKFKTKYIYGAAHNKLGANKVVTAAMSPWK